MQRPHILDDSELFNNIKHRDRDAFNTLFRKYYTCLCRYSYAICLSKTDAEENVQNMFINLWEKATTVNIDLSVKAYLYSAARNFTLNAIQKQQTEQHYINEYSERIHAGEQEEKNEDTTISTLIQSGVETLPAKCREIFILCKQEGLTYDEISAYLNISEKTVDNQMGIALRKLREYLHPRLQKLLIFLLLYLFS